MHRQKAALVLGHQLLAVVVVGLVVGCSGSSDVQDLPPLASDVTDESTSTSSSSTTSSTTTPTTPTTTETTLSERAQAEAEIEAAVLGWALFPRDTSLGEEGLPLEFLTGPMHKRVKELGESRTAAGEIQRSRGDAAVEILSIDVNFDTGFAEVDLCMQGGDELVDASTGEILAEDLDEAFTAILFAQLVEGEWKLFDFFSTQAGDSPQTCQIEPS